MSRFTFGTDDDAVGFTPWFEWNSLADAVVDPDVTWLGVPTLRCEAHSILSPPIEAVPDSFVTATVTLRQDCPTPELLLVDYVLGARFQLFGTDYEVYSRFRLGQDWQAETVRFWLPERLTSYRIGVGFDPSPGSNAQDHHDAFHLAELVTS